MLGADLQRWAGRERGKEQPNPHWGGNSWVFSGQRCRERSPRMLQQAAAAWHGLPGARSSFSIALRLLPGTFLPKAGDHWSYRIAQPAVSGLLHAPINPLEQVGLSTK